MKTTQERLPRTGWSRLPDPRMLPSVTSASCWQRGNVVVISALENAEAPDGRGDTIPQWHVSVSERGERPSARGLARALGDFGMVGTEEDNHHPGIARHFWLPIDSARRVDCQCKTDEVVVREADGYTWTNPKSGEAECRGCELERLLAKPCPIHSKKEQSCR